MNLPSAKKGSLLQGFEFFALLTAFAALALFSKSCAELVISALKLCFYRVIPALFPFAVLSSMLIGLGAPACLAKALSKLFHLSPAGCTVLVSGLISGFPIGAINTAQLYSEGKIGKKEAENLLAFTNNPSAPFCISIVGGGILGDLKKGVAIYVLISLSSLLTAFALRGREKRYPYSETKASAMSLSGAIKGAVNSMLMIVGHITLFTVVNSALKVLLSNFIKNRVLISLISAFTELSGGLFALSGQVTDKNTLFVLCTLACAFSGVCVHMQVRGALKGQGLSLKKFGLAKLIQALFCAVCAELLCVLFF